MTIPKPALHRIWAKTAPGINVVDPDITTPGKFNSGWVAEVPPFEHFNFLQQLFTENTAYLNQEGIGEYDALTDYTVGAITKGSDNITYQSRIVNGPDTSLVDPVGDSSGTWIIHNGFVNLASLSGVDITGATDSSAAINSAIQNFKYIFWPPYPLRLDSPIHPRSDVHIFGVKGGSQIWQYGQYAVEQNIPDLENFTLDGMLFDFKSASTSRYDSCFKLGAYKGCRLENFRFVRYDDQTIVERSPDAAASFNGIDNIHRNWSVSACAHLDIAIGLEGYYHKHTGDSVTTVLTTDIVWPEQFNSSVIVVKENNNRIFTQMDLTTDYSVSYDGSNKLIVTLVSAATSAERIHIWPSQPRTDGNRRPYSNNTWENINCDFIFVRGHTAVRWVDAEDYVFNRMTAAANFVKLYEFNPFDERNGQGGDFMAWYGCVLTYQSGLVGSPSTLTGIDLGPGSVFNTGVSIRGDLLWRHSGINRLVQTRDTEQVVLTGTITTNGSAVVIGSGTKFQDELTLVGAVPDLVIIDGTKRGIVSIDSDTQITLSSSAPAQVGIPVTRFNLQNTVSYDMNFSASGEGQTNTKSASMGHFIKGSGSVATGEATILSGQTFIEVPFSLSRIPRIGEIIQTPHSGLNGRTVQISNIDADSFRINVNTAAASNYTFGWKIDLMEIN